MNQVDRKTKTYLKIFYEMTIFNDLSLQYWREVVENGHHLTALKPF